MNYKLHNYRYLWSKPLRQIIRFACFTALSVSAHASALAQETQAPACKISLEPVPVTFAGDLLFPTVAGSINGTPTVAIIDIANPSTTLNRASLAKIGVRSSEVGKVRGVGGSRPEYVAKVDEIAVGSAKAKGKYLAYNFNSSNFGINVGTNFLLQTDLELSFKERTIRFVSSKNCENEHLAYWGEVATSLPFDYHSYYDLRPEFKIKVEGKELTALLSTTVENSVIDAGAAGRLPGKTAAMFSGQGPKRARGLGKRTMPLWTGEFASIEIGGEKVTHSKLNVMSLAGISADVILGMDFIRAHRILISMTQRRIYFTYTGGPVFNTGDNTEWLMSEVNTGNVDAMYRMGTNAERDGRIFSAESLTWYRKAAAAGSVGAKRRMADYEFYNGNFAVSAQTIREVIRTRSPSAFSAIDLYTAASRSGDRDAALQELKTLRATVLDSSLWEDNLLDFFMGKISGEKLRKLAADEPSHAANLLCEAHYHIGQQHMIAGQKELARAAFELTRDTCPKDEPEAAFAVAELSRM